MMLDSSSPTPTVLVAGGGDDWRLMVMQYVSIVWPNAQVDEIASTGAALEHAAPDRYELLLLGYGSEGTQDLDRLALLRAKPNAASIIALLDGPPESWIPLQRLGVRCLARGEVSKAKITDALRAVWQERSTGTRDSDRTQPLDPEAAGSGSSRPYFGELAKDALRGYEIVRPLGEGGSARVYLARRNSDGLVVTVKTLASSSIADPRALKRFLEEYAIISRLSSPLVVRIYDHGINDQYVYTVMEYLPGGDLKARMKGALAPQQALYLTAAAARALVAIHEAGVMHLDLKPQNVMFRSDGSLVLVDFGVSLLMDINASHLDLTLGTPAYASPEQVLARPLDGRSDLYSLGVMLFEMLTGQSMYCADNVVDLLYKHAHEPVPRLPPELANYQPLLDRLVAKKPQERFASARTMLGYIEQRFGLKT